MYFRIIHTNFYIDCSDILILHFFHVFHILILPIDTNLCLHKIDKLTDNFEQNFAHLVVD